MVEFAYIFAGLVAWVILGVIVHWSIQYAKRSNANAERVYLVYGALLVILFVTLILWACK